MVGLKLTNWRLLPPTMRLLLTALVIALGVLFSMLIWTVQIERTPYLFAWVAGMIVIWCWNFTAGFCAAIVTAALVEIFVLDRGLPFGQFNGIQVVFFSVTMLGAYSVARWQRKLAAENERTLSQLHLSERRFRIMADAAPCLIWVAGTDRLTNFFNKSWLNFTGKTLEDSIRCDGMDDIHADDKQRIRAAFHQHFDARQPYEMEYRLRRHDGDYRWVLERAVPLFEDDGSFTGYIGSCVDITDRKEAEQAARETANRWRSVLEHMPVMLTAYDDQGNRVMWNQECERVTGYRKSDMIGNPRHLELLYPDPDYRAEILAQYPQAGIDFRDYVIRTTCKDGKERQIAWSSIAGTHTIAGWPHWSVGVDITARLEAEQKWRDNEQNLRLALVNAPLIVTRADRSLQFTWSYSACGDLPLEAGQQQIESILPPSVRGELVALQRDTLREVRSIQREITFRYPDGQAYVYAAAAEPIQERGAVVGVTVAMLDITERKRQEAEREKTLRLAQEAQRAAEEASQLKTNFLGMISHELSTPMTSIKGFTDTLLATDVTWDADQQREFLEIIRRDAERMTELISHLLDLSRLEAGRLTIEAQPFNLDESLDIVLLQLASLTINHDFSAEIPPDLPLVCGDVRRVAQIILNLVGNAARYSPPHTTIALTTTLEAHCVRVDVSDEGPGIAPEMHEAVFESFRQLEAPGLSKGAGLGLAICKGLVEAQGGKIWVQDRPPPGATISFTLPLA
jgi:PAS domain S-box-containing protein